LKNLSFFGIIPIMERKIILHFVAFVGKLGSEFVPEGPLRVEIEVSVYVDSSVSSVPVVSTDRGFVVPCDHCDDPVEVAGNYNGSGMTVTDIFDASFNDGLLRIALTDHARKRFQLQGEYWEIAKLDPIY
jgi:hypothetical protein